MAIFQRLKNIFNIDESVIHKSEISVQREFAPRLRKAVIDHLATDDGVVASGFRSEYAIANGEHYKNFLAKQGKNGVWATDIEAAAAGELFGCNIVVTEDKKDATYCVYRAENKDAPTIHLYNSNNTHWYTAHGHTLGDGNCLYNAIVKELQRLAANELKFKPETQPTPVQYVASKGLFGTAKSTPERTIAIIENQKAIEAAIARHPKPSELAAQQRAEQERISKLSPEERAQIAADYKYALDVAAGDANSSLKK